MGVSYELGEENSVKYPTVIEELVSQNLIASTAYSVWLNDLGKLRGSKHVRPD